MNERSEASLHFYADGASEKLKLSKFSRPSVNYSIDYRSKHLAMSHTAKNYPFPLAQGLRASLKFDLMLQV
jgi:hypothetical protein